MRKLYSSFLLVFVFSLNLFGQTITVDYSVSTQPVPSTYQPGIFLVPKTANAGNDFLNNGIHYNSIRGISIETAMNYWTVGSINDVMAQLELQKPNIVLAASRCDKLVIPILKMPLWLSSSSDNTDLGGGFKVFNAVPPADYPTWNLLMDSIVSKINDQWGLDVHYEIWNEPDIEYWQGSEAEYFELFYNTLSAIKTNHPNAKVGGPTVSSFSSKFSGGFPNGYLSDTQLDSTIIARVIDSCVTWGMPLDFVSWHNFGINLHSQDRYFDYLNQKLVSSGHGAVPLIVSEWNLGAGYRETILDAAYMVNHTQSLFEHGITAHQVAAWQDFDSSTTEFHGDYGLLSWGALHKPSWKALRLLNSLGGPLLSVDSSNYRNLNILSTYENDTLKILVSNYALDGRAVAAFTLFYDYQVSGTDLQQQGYTASKLDSVLQGFIVLTGTDPLTIAINSCIPVYQTAQADFQNGRNIDLIIPGIAGNHTGQQTRIDSTHNNVIFRYDSLLNAGFNRVSAVNYLYPNSDFERENINLSDSIYSFHIEANGVMLIELYIPEIVLEIAENPEIELPIVYPNPTIDQVNINIEAKDLDKINIYDLNGRLVKTTKNPSFSIAEQESGTYILMIYSKGEVFTRKLVKE